LIFLSDKVSLAAAVSSLLVGEPDTKRGGGLHDFSGLSADGVFQIGSATRAIPEMM
jgi:hypothetical protein